MTCDSTNLKCKMIYIRDEANAEIQEVALNENTMESWTPSHNL